MGNLDFGGQGIVIHDVGDIICVGWVRGDSSLEAELELRFCSAVQLLVDGRVIAIEGNVCTSGVGEAFECHIDIWGNS